MLLVALQRRPFLLRPEQEDAIFGHGEPGDPRRSRVTAVNCGDSHPFAPEVRSAHLFAKHRVAPDFAFGGSLLAIGALLLIDRESVREYLQLLQLIASRHANRSIQVRIFPICWVICYATRQRARTRCASRRLVRVAGAWNISVNPPFAAR